MTGCSTHILYAMDTIAILIQRTISTLESLENAY